MFKKTQIFHNIDQNNVISRTSFNLLAEQIVSLIKRSFTANDEIFSLHISTLHTASGFDQTFVRNYRKIIISILCKEYIISNLYVSLNKYFNFSILLFNRAILYKLSIQELIAESYEFIAEILYIKNKR